MELEFKIKRVRGGQAEKEMPSPGQSFICQVFLG